MGPFFWREVEFHQLSVHLVWQPNGKKKNLLETNKEEGAVKTSRVKAPQRGSQAQPDRKERRGETVQSEEEQRALKKSQDGCLERKSSSSHRAPICSGTNHCSARQAQRGKHFSSPHRRALESRSTFPDGSDSSSRLSWSCFR